MIRNDYRKKQKIIKNMWMLLIVAGCVGMYLLTKQVATVLLTGELLVVARFLSNLRHLTDKNYIEHVVLELSELCESLTTLQEKEIFPENEDTQVSKLQNQIVKLVRILRRQKEDSIKDEENMKALVSDISHQLKTPLANLKMYTEFLEEEGITEEQRREYTQIVKFSVERLNFLSENMIKVSRLESGLIQLKPHMLSLNETVLMALKDIFPKAMAAGTEITYVEEEVTVFHDRRWSAEAIFNLLDNAVKYSPKGSYIGIVIRRLGMFVAVEVRDMAPVIKEEERNKIFRRFYRGQSSTNKEGIGIGLYLAREIVVKQGGYMNLSSYERGNVFTIYLPIEKS